MKKIISLEIIESGWNSDVTKIKSLLKVKYSFRSYRTLWLKDEVIEDFFTFLCSYDKYDIFIYRTYLKNQKPLSKKEHNLIFSKYLSSEVWDRYKETQGTTSP